MRFLILLLILISLIKTTLSANILFISPSLAKSLLIFSGRIADTLVEAGHNVVI